MKIKVSTEIDGYLKADHLKISTTSIESVDVGEIVWNQIDGTFDMGLIGGVTLQAGQEMHIYGKANEAISNGEAVMFAGVQGDHILISRADATIVNANPEYLIGVSTQSFTTNQFGYVTTLGNVRGLNTLAYTLGTILYYNSESTTDGLLTATEPTAPNAKIEVAAVVKVHGTQGILLVRPHVMPRVKDLQDIYAPSPTQAKGLFWNNTNSRYQNYTVPEILGYTPADDANVVHKTGNESITGNKSFSNSTSNPAITVSNSNNGSQGIFSTNTSVGSGIYSGNSSSGTGITSSNGSTGNGIYSGNGGTGTGIFSYNGGTGIGIFSENITSGINAYLTNVGSGKNLVLNNTSTGTGMPFTIQKTGVDKLTISDTGYITSSDGATFTALGGVGTRTVVASATGILSTIPTTNGTVTSVSELTLGTTGTDLSSTVANSTTTPVITLNIPTASATNRGVLSSTDWTTFSNKATDSLVVHKAGAETITGAKTFQQTAGSAICINAESSGYGGVGVKGIAENTGGIGIYGKSSSLISGFAGWFDGQVSITDKLGIGTSYPKSSLHVSKNGNIAGGSILLGNETSLTNKYGVVTGTNYDNVLYPTGVNIASSVSIAAENRVNIGGGIDELNSANTINFYTTTLNTVGAGIIRMKILSTGEIGIGTINPFSKVQIQETSSNQLIVSYDSDIVNPTIADTTTTRHAVIYHGGFIANAASGANNNLTLGMHGGGTANGIKFQTGNTLVDRMFIRNDGNVGIGTTSPSSPLDVVSNPSALGLTIRNRIGNDYSNSIFTSYDGTVSNASFGWAINRLRFTSGGIGDAYERLSITSDGSVGIGVTSPASGYKLDVNGAITANNTLSIQGIDSTNLESAADEVRVSGYGIMGNRGGLYFTNASTTGNIQFGIGGAHAAATKMQINPNGDVGIGINPTEKLHVIGNGLFTGNVTASTGVNITSGGVTSTVVNASSTFTLGTTSAHSVTLRTNNVARLTINSAGAATFASSVTATSHKSNVGYGDVSFTAYYGGALILPTTTTGSVYIGNTYDTVSLYAGGSGTFKSLAGTGTRNVAADTSGQLIISATSNPSYKSYTALITQTGTANPTVIVLQNEIGAIVWTRNTIGSYTGTLASAFVLNKTVILATKAPATVSGFSIGGVYESINTIRIYTDTSAGGVDGQLNKATIEIRVYN